MLIAIKITRSDNAAHYGVPVGTVVDEELETYVAAVVASEIGNAPLEACKAQAVASRTFAYRYILNGKTVSDSSASAQAFRIDRYSDKYPNCKTAAEKTVGYILTYGGAPADTYFSHSNGGMTKSSEEQWGGVRPYLPSQPDPWDAATGINKLGHGVGMSQVGAKYAAEHGVTFKDILAFYYPKTHLEAIRETEEVLGMISLSQFLEGLQKNAKRIKGYKQPYSGQNGLSDCIGFIIGGLELEGQKWGGTHGSNYAKRYRTKHFHTVTSKSQLKVGEIVYKGYKPGEYKYDLPDRYKTGPNPDLIDYYHVGVVTSVNPLVISHCSTGGMNYDNDLGKWKYAGECSLVDYGSAGGSVVMPETAATASGNVLGKMFVDVPDDTTVNVRATRSVDSKVLVRLDEGTEVEVVARLGDWCRVKYRINKTGSGYVMTKFISKEKTIDVPDDTTVNVRVKPSIHVNKVTTLPEGTKVKILAKEGDWSHVEYTVPKEGTGFVMSRYLVKR